MFTPFKKRTSANPKQDPGQYAFPLVDDKGALLVSIAGSANPDPSLPSNPQFLQETLLDNVSGEHTSSTINLLGYGKWSVHVILSEGSVDIQTSLDGVNWYSEIQQSESALLSFSGVIGYLRVISDSSAVDTTVKLLAVL